MSRHLASSVPHGPALLPGRVVERHRRHEVLGSLLLVSADERPDVFTDGVESLRGDPLFDKVFQCPGNWDAEDFCLGCFSMHTASPYYL
jgi:hypothetical protein